jgi:CBS domain-containing protein
MSEKSSVGDYRSKGYLEVSPSDSLEAVARDMVNSGYEFAIVMEDGSLRGIVSAGEIIHEVRASVISRLTVEKIPQEFRQMLMSELMNNPKTINFMQSCGFEGTKLAICMGEKNTIEEAIQLFASSAVEQVLVLDQDGIVGIFTERDLLKAITELTQ